MTSFSSLQFYHPVLYRFFSSEKDDSINIGRSFLMHGRNHTGKLWSVIQILQLLNCDHFLSGDHEILNCYTCKNILKLSENIGVYSLISNTHIHLLEQFIIFKLKNPVLEKTVIQIFLHEIFKIQSILDQETVLYNLNKSQKTPKAQLQFLQDIIHEIYHAVDKNQVLNLSDKNLEKFLSTIKTLSPYHISTNYIQYLFKKIYIQNHHLKYPALIVKDTASLDVVVMNKLLKMIEEPPDNLLIFLISTKPRHILSTIHSRCIPFHLRPYSNKHLQNLQKNLPEFLVNELSSSGTIPSTPNYTLEGQIKVENVLQIIDYYRDKKLTHSLSDSYKKEILNKLYLGVKEYGLKPEQVNEVLSFFLL